MFCSPPAVYKHTCTNTHTHTQACTRTLAQKHTRTATHTKHTHTTTYTHIHQSSALDTKIPLFPSVCCLLSVSINLCVVSSPPSAATVGPSASRAPTRPARVCSTPWSAASS